MRERTVGAGGGSTHTFVGVEAYRTYPSGPLRAAHFDARIDSAPRKLLLVASVNLPFVATQDFSLLVCC